MTILIHETHPAYALTIARTGKIMAGPILGDSGVNVEIKGHPLGFHQDQAEQRGAKLIFEWTGPVSKMVSGTGYPPDVLYDQHPHRGFVPAGTTKSLCLIGIELVGKDASWSDAEADPKFDFKNIRKWIKSKMPRWDEEKNILISKEISSIVNKRINISVVLPRPCIYESILREKFPNAKWS